MSAFLTDLEVEEVADSDPKQDGRTTWKLLLPFVYQSDLLRCVVTVPTGFITDFASVPRIPVAWFVAGGAGTKASVIHDYLYASHLVPRSDADAVFREAMAVSGQPAWRRALMWAGVRLFGQKPYDEDAGKA